MLVEEHTGSLGPASRPTTGEHPLRLGRGRVGLGLEGRVVLSIFCEMSFPF